MTKRTLLLTAWYLPIKVLRWQDAVKMIYEETVDVVVEYDEEIRSPSVTWRMPAVVRLEKSYGYSKGGVKFSRANVYLRDRYACQYCSRQLDWGSLTSDHVVPRSRGGRTCFENIVTACRACNSRKADRTCDEAGMFPRNTPGRPKRLPLSTRVDTRGAPKEWAPFLAHVT